MTTYTEHDLLGGMTPLRALAVGEAAAVFPHRNVGMLAPNGTDAMIDACRAMIAPGREST